MKPRPKSDGSIRYIFDTKPILKRIHNKILTEIFRNVSYPPYLHGSIKDKKSPRDYISNCKQHTYKRFLTNEDVSSFFDSISSEQVYKLWKYFFNFTEVVARTLTKLTTYNDKLPQGAKTSSYIANLIFWDIEASLVEDFKKINVSYTRFVDDITWSTSIYATPRMKTYITSRIYKMLSKKGVKPNRKKRISFSNSNHMSVNNLNVNSHRPTLNKKLRNNIRSMVCHCEYAEKTYGKDSQYFKDLYASTLGKVNNMGRLHKIEAMKLRKRLLVVKPCYL